ncbi:WG repeat-containing protein [Pedobacter duraquae]|nr:WG repeat-containing protein [Pedobacter duraquae]
MKRILIILLCIWQGAGAQEILVPYKTGNRWGLADLQGKLVVPTNYDWISIGKDYPGGYFGFKKGNQSGVIYNRKEIIVETGEGHEYAVLDEKFILGRYKEKYDVNKAYNSMEERNAARRNPREMHTIYNLKGQNIYPENFARLSIIDTIGSSARLKKQSKYTIFYSVNYENKHSIFVFDIDKQLITKWLLKDYDKFKLESDLPVLSMRNAVFSAQKDRSSPEELVSFDLLKNTVHMSSKIVSGKNDTGKGSPLYNGDVKGDPSSDIVIVESGRPSEIGKKRKLRYDMRFIVAGNSITYSKSDQASNRQNKDFTLPFKADNFKVEVLYSTLPPTKDSIERQIANVLVIESGGKKGLCITDSLFIPPVYDEIKALISHGKTVQDLSFLVGLKDKQTNNMKYGTIDVYGKTVIPVIYDEIAIDQQYSSSRKSFVENLYNEDLRVSINKKSGYITTTNQVKLSVEYDSIYKNDLNYLQNESEFMVLNKNGKYGLLKFRYAGNLLIKPQFEKKIGYYVENYKSKKGLNLLALITNEGQLYAYATKDGLIFAGKEK